VLNSSASHSVVGLDQEGWLALSGRRLGRKIIRREGRRDRSVMDDFLSDTEFCKFTHLTSKVRLWNFLWESEILYLRHY
jgi:hypothetical protein